MKQLIAILVLLVAAFGVQAEEGSPQLFQVVVKTMTASTIDGVPQLVSYVNFESPAPVIPGCQGNYLYEGSHAGLVRILGNSQDRGELIWVGIANAVTGTLCSVIYAEPVIQ